MTTVPVGLPGVAIVSAQASLQMGGEAALAVHYFQGLLQRQVPVVLVCHARARAELLQLFPQAQSRIFYAEDSWLQVVLWRLGQCLPQRVAAATTAVLLHGVTQRRQLPLVQALVQRGLVEVVHQPMPVSPRMPSVLTGLGVPVVMGPMNGSMDYPPGFAHREPIWVRALVYFGRRVSALANRLLPGKLHADVLLVANERTRCALPPAARGQVVEMVENGVNLAHWPAKCWPTPVAVPPAEVRFCFVGRLVDWKGVDLLLRAFAVARQKTPHSWRLDIVGDGPQASRLLKLAKSLHLVPELPGAPGSVVFHGWQSQTECSQTLRACDALVLPSLLECGGAVVLEAMASALPVIAANWGGPAQYLDASCGMLLPVTSECALMDGLVKALVRLANDPTLRKSMGQQGRLKVEQQHDWQQKIGHMLAIYKTVRKVHTDTA